MRLSPICMPILFVMMTHCCFGQLEVTEDVLTKAKALSEQDSLETIQYIKGYEKAPLDSLHLELSYVKLELTKSTDVAKRIEILDDIIEKFQQAPEPGYLLAAMHRKGNYLLSKGEYLDADSVYDESLKLSRNSENSLMEMKLGLSKSGSLLRQSKFKEAKKLLNKVLHQARMESDTFHILASYSNTAICQTYLGKLDSAIIIYDKGLSLAKLSKDTARIANSLRNIGNVHLRQKSYSEAAPYYRESMVLSKKTKDEVGVIRALASLGNIYEQQKLPDSSSYYYQAALDKATAKGDLRLANKIKGTLGSSYYHAGELDKAQTLLEEAISNEKSPHTKSAFLQRLALIHRERGAYEKAIQLFKEAQAIAIESDDVSVQRTCLKQLAFLADAQKDYKSAYMYKLEEYDLIDSLFSMDKARLITEFDTKYEVEKKESRNKLLANELSAESLRSRNYKLFLFLSLAFLAAFLGWIRSLISTNKLKKEHNAVLSERNDLLSTLNEDLTEENEKLLFAKDELEDLNKRLQGHVLQLEAASQETSTQDKLEVKSLDKIHMIDTVDLLYITAENDGVRLHLNGGGSIWTDVSMKKLMNRLSGDFVKIFRSTVVNMNNIKWVNHSTLKMKNNMELKVGRTYKNDLITHFNQHKV